MIEAAFLSLEMGHRKKRKAGAQGHRHRAKNYAPHNILGRVLEQLAHSEQGITELETAVRLAPELRSALQSGTGLSEAGKNAAAPVSLPLQRMDQKQEGQECGAPAILNA